MNTCSLLETPTNRLTRSKTRLSLLLGTQLKQEFFYPLVPKKEPTFRNTKRTASVNRSRCQEVKGCGLCGNTRKKLKLTECCGNYICDDMTRYKPFDHYSSCNKNHNRYSLCYFHFIEDHKGIWQDCNQCQIDLDGFENEERFNFKKDVEIANEMYSCANCDFSSKNVLAFFPCTQTGFYCRKKRCEERKNIALDKQFYLK